MKRSFFKSRAEDLEAQLAQLEHLTREQLVEGWRELCGSDPATKDPATCCWKDRRSPTAFKSAAIRRSQLLYPTSLGARARRRRPQSRDAEMQRQESIAVGAVLRSGNGAAYLIK